MVVLPWLEKDPALGPRAGSTPRYDALIARLPPQRAALLVKVGTELCDAAARDGVSREAVAAFLRAC